MGAADDAASPPFLFPRLAWNHNEVSSQSEMKRMVELENRISNDNDVFTSHALKRDISVFD